MSTKARSRFERNMQRAYSKLDFEPFAIKDSSPALSFNGLFEQTDSESVSTYDGIRTAAAAEVSFLVSDFAPSQLTEGTVLYREDDGTYWKCESQPMDDGLADEAVVRVTRSRRTRTGAN